MKKTRTILLCLILLACTTPYVLGDPDRGVSLYTPYNNIQISTSQDLNFELEITNIGDITELLDLAVSSPSGWETQFVREQYIITSLNIKNNDNLTVDLNIAPIPGETAGFYNFTVNVESRDKAVSDEIEINVELTESIASKEYWLIHPILQ